MRSTIRRSARAGLCVGLLLLNSSCNVFGFMDQPGDNEEYLSKARACFDEGDIECAREYYGKLSGSYSDVKHSELAYTILYEFGVDMGAFMEAFGDGGSGNGLTVLANRILEKVGTVDATTRAELYEAYEKVALIDDPELQGLVRFLTALAFGAHLLAENAQDGTFEAEDVVASPSACQAEAACIVNPATCNAAAGSDLTRGDGGDITNSAAVGGVPGLDLFDTAMDEVELGLDAVGVSGKFSSTNSLVEAIGNANSHCYRQEMLNQGIGFLPGEQ